ncbi:hypothetical protein CP556_04120 [Natrinema sp. CBA1119]|uniref:DUF7344 domain-containing protein n=1 Tax=Natrinema sp. CBA1119 TaxID=1608465 RepID=UPI000BF33B9F|nr:hypothetical protein [Natrinema sp. CBA1119]PGF15396.1 hypothetical protein CP556_04120 [Natrinema sp. CBA1119]
MSAPPSAELTTALDVLAAPRRRYLLATLLEREDTTSVDRSSASKRLSMERLAIDVTTVEHDCPIVTNEQYERVHTDLIHAHVPRLVDAGLVTRRTDGGETTVALAEHPIFESEWVRSLLADPTGETLPVDETTVNRTLEALRDPRRRTVCAVLSRRRGTVSVTDLAAAVLSREGGDGTRLVDVTEPECSSVSAALVHEQLPVLSDAGLVEYDAEAARVALATDAPQWRIDWLTEGPLADVADPVRRPARRNRRSDSSGTSDGATTESTAADAPAPTASAANGDRMLWTLARPRAERAAGGESSSPREVASLLGESSAASEQQDGPST